MNACGGYHLMKFRSCAAICWPNWESSHLHMETTRDEWTYHMWLWTDSQLPDSWLDGSEWEKEKMEMEGKDKDKKQERSRSRSPRRAPPNTPEDRYKTEEPTLQWFLSTAQLWIIDLVSFICMVEHMYESQHVAWKSLLCKLHTAEVFPAEGK